MSPLSLVGAGPREEVGGAWALTMIARWSDRGAAGEGVVEEEQELEEQRLYRRHWPLEIEEQI